MTISDLSWRLCALGVLVGIAAVAPVQGQEAIRLREVFTPGYQYRVSSRSEIKGQLTPGEEKGKPGKPLTLAGKSALDYDERVLGVTNQGTVERTIRVYRKVDIERHVGGQPQSTTIRSGVRRLVLLRQGNVEVPFSPEGPLLWDEIDIVRTDVFTPALTGLFPPGEVRIGDRWKASEGAVQELTDLETIDEGVLECRLENVVALEKRRHARVSFSGTVRGPDQDGASRHRLEGYLYFDLESNHVSYLTLNGISIPLKGDREMGRIEGQFVLTRQANLAARELSEESLRGLTLRETEDNTLLLYDNPGLGVRLLYPRRWRLAGGLGRQVRFDGKNGSGLQITLDPPGQARTAMAFLGETRTFFEGRKGRILRMSPPRRVEVPGQRQGEQFSLEVELDGKSLVMVYYVIRQPEGGMILAATLPAASAEMLRADVERIARSLTLTRALKE